MFKVLLAMSALFKTLSTLGLVAATLALLSGCASYKLGSSAEIPFETIYIQPATNDSFAPQAQPIVSSQLRQAFIRDGRVKLVTKPEDADAVLTVNLTDYKRNSASRSTVDSERASDFDITLESEVSLYNQRSGDYYFEERTLLERTNAYVRNPYVEEGNLSVQNLDAYHQGEREAMPRLARDLARQIADEVLSAW